MREIGKTTYSRRRLLTPTNWQVSRLMFLSFLAWPWEAAAQASARYWNRDAAQADNPPEHLSPPDRGLWPGDSAARRRRGGRHSQHRAHPGDFEGIAARTIC